MARQCCQMTSESKGHLVPEPAISLLLMSLPRSYFTSLGVRGTCHRRLVRSHRLRLVRSKRRAVRGARLGENFKVKTTRSACGIITSSLSWTPRVLTTHAARSRDLAEGRRNRSVTRRARCVGESRQRNELGERPDSEESRRPVRKKRLRDSKAASHLRDPGETAEVAKKWSVFGHGTKCNTCAWSFCSTVVYWLWPPGRTSRITSKYSGAEGFNDHTWFVAWENKMVQKCTRYYEEK